MNKMRSFVVGSLLGLSGLALASTFTLFQPANGILKGTTTSYVTSAATSADVRSLWGGSCTSVTYLRGDGTCTTPSGSGTVTSVALTMPTGFSVSGSPITGSGTFGVTTSLNGLLKGTGSGFTTAASADVIGLWTGTCSSSTFLRGDGSCAVAGGGGSTPGGSNGQVQINVAGAFGADSAFVFDTTLHTMVLDRATDGNAIQFSRSATNVGSLVSADTGGSVLESISLCNAGSTACVGVNNAGGISLTTSSTAVITGALSTTGAITAGSGFSGNGLAITSLNASNLSNGTVPDARMSGTYSGLLTFSNVSNSYAGNGTSLAINASNLGTGTVPSSRISGTYSSAVSFSNVSNTYAGDGAALTNLNASNLNNGTVPDARFPASLPALNGSALTSLNASNLGIGTIPTGRLSGTYSSALTFSNASNSFTGDGSGLTGLNASNLGSGTVPSARLSGTYSNALTLSSASNAITANTITATSATVGGSAVCRADGVNCPGSSSVKFAFAQIGLSPPGPAYTCTIFSGAAHSNVSSCLNSAVGTITITLTGSVFSTIPVCSAAFGTATFMTVNVQSTTQITIQTWNTAGSAGVDYISSPINLTCMGT